MTSPGLAAPSCLQIRGIAQTCLCSVGRAFFCCHHCRKPPHFPLPEKKAQGATQNRALKNSIPTSSAHQSHHRDGHFRAIWSAKLGQEQSGWMFCSVAIQGPDYCGSIRPSQLHKSPWKCILYSMDPTVAVGARAVAPISSVLYKHLCVSTQVVYCRRPSFQSRPLPSTLFVCFWPMR
ncbi:hypothetical protein F5883DRAFT_119497 [Diaporthe sp. PMI_573]|nr:hypothetical protein F5883DRAFT_119497 [Diaporthaceae sp. PMI_573]